MFHPPFLAPYLYTILNYNVSYNYDKVDWEKCQLARLIGLIPAIFYPRRGAWGKKIVTQF